MANEDYAAFQEPQYEAFQRLQRKAAALDAHHEYYPVFDENGRVKSVFKLVEKVAASMYWGIVYSPDQNIDNCMMCMAGTVYYHPVQTTPLVYKVIPEKTTLKNSRVSPEMNAKAHPLAMQMMDAANGDVSTPSRPAVPQKPGDLPTQQSL